jgi:type II secretory pathway component GspD/PulD (secretin)
MPGKALLLALLVAGRGAAWAETNEAEIVTIQAIMFQCTTDVARELFRDPLVTGRTYAITEDTVRQVSAFEEQKKLRVLCRPQVATISGAQAQVRAVREFQYVAEVTVDGGAVVPSFRTREVGTILNMTPTVSPDSQTISVTLAPEYSELHEIRKSAIALADSRYRAEVDMPVFKTYSTQTSVVLASGRPVLLCVCDAVENTDPRATPLQILTILTATVRHPKP